jgi:hypothetical protein
VWKTSAEQSIKQNVLLKLRESELFIHDAAVNGSGGFWRWV